MEEERGGRIPYLDMEIMRTNNGNIAIKWYKKPTTSGRILNYKSNHPMKQKMATAMRVMTRANMLTDMEYRNETERVIDEILTKNQYPTDLIEKM